MTIHEIVAAASELCISYGEYVNRYEPKPPPHIPNRVCKRCGRGIGPRCGNARFCIECADDRRTEAFAAYDIKRKERGRAAH